VEYFVSKGANDWNHGMCGAASGGHTNLVMYFVSKGANNWNWGMREAAFGGHMDLVKYFVSKGANDRSERSSNPTSSTSKGCKVGALLLP